MSGANAQGLIIERILRDRCSVWRQISQQHDLNLLNRQMFVTSVASLAVYGAVLGSSNGLAQAIASLVKLPLLFLATLAICLPTLYLFNLVFAARLSMSQTISLIMVCITVTAVLTLAFAPISLFFLITARSYEFFKLLNVAILLLTAIVGLRFLTTGMQAVDGASADGVDAVAGAAGQADGVDRAGPEVPAGSGLPGVLPVATQEVGVVPPGSPVPGVVVTVAPGLAPAGNGVQPGVSTTMAIDPVAQDAQAARFVAVHGAAVANRSVGQLRGADLQQRRSASASLLYVWIMLFGFVGTQLAWTLRPFFGSPDEPFEVFRHLGGTFYSDVLQTIGRLFGV